jgi:ABC-2 type transport system permease protein
MLAGAASVLWLVTFCARMQARELAGSQMSLVVNVVQPVILVTLISRMSSPAMPALDSTRLVSGVVMMSVWSSTIWAAGGILRRDQAQGTLTAQLVGVRSPFLVLFGKAMGASARSITLTLASAVGAAMALGVRPMVRLPGWVAVAMVLTLVCAASMGMLISSLFLLTRHAIRISNGLSYPIYLLGGLLIPVNRLPSELRLLSNVMSLRWVQDFLVGAANGSVRGLSAAYCLALSTVYFALAVEAFRVFVQRGRASGAITLV